MKKYVASVLLSSLLAFQSASADTYAPIPETIEEQIDASTIIVKGRLGEIISEKKFYGYSADGQDSDLESLSKEKNIPTEILSQMGIPLVEWEIIVE